MAATQAKNWLWLSLFFLIIVRTQLVAAQGNRNFVAVQTAIFCTSTNPMTPPAVKGRAMDWFKAITAECHGNEFLIATAWQTVLVQSPARLSAIRAARPTDTALAQFAADRYPTYAEAYFWLGDALVAAKESKTAIAAYEQALILQPTNATAWVELGAQYEIEGNWEAAVQAYNQGCSRHDRGGNGCVKAGKVYLEQEQYELAIARYQESLVQIPTFYPPSARGLVVALLALGRTEEATFYLKMLAEHGDMKAQETLYRLQNSTNQSTTDDE